MLCIGIAFVVVLYQVKDTFISCFGELGTFPDDCLAWVTSGALLKALSQVCAYSLLYPWVVGHAS